VGEPLLTNETQPSRSLSKSPSLSLFFAFIFTASQSHLPRRRSPLVHQCVFSPFFPKLLLLEPGVPPIIRRPSFLTRRWRSSFSFFPDFFLVFEDFVQATVGSFPRPSFSCLSVFHLGSSVFSSFTDEFPFSFTFSLFFQTFFLPNLPTRWGFFPLVLFEARPLTSPPPRNTFFFFLHLKLARFFFWPFFDRVFPPSPPYR